MERKGINSLGGSFRLVKLILDLEGGGDVQLLMLDGFNPHREKITW